MTNQYPTFNCNLNLKTTVTLDEAVAKMLGLMRGAVREVESNSKDTNLEYLPELKFDLEDYFEEMRDNLIEDVVEVFERDSTEEEKSTAYYDLLKCDQLINKAQEYKSAIDLELSNGKESALKLDQKEADEYGKNHIYLASLDEWVRQKYQFSIYPDRNMNVSNPELITLDYQNSKTVETIVMDESYHTYEDRVRAVDQIKSWVKSNKQRGYSDLETNNLLITFFSSLLDHAKYKGNNRPESLAQLASDINVSGTAETLSQQIKNAFNDVSGQSAEAIRTRIEDAKRAALNMLSIRK